MEEKQEKKQKPEFKGNMGVVWLVGILVILLGCITVYTLKITAENKDLKQAPPQQLPVIEEKQEQATKEENANAVTTTDETKSTVSKEETKTKSEENTKTYNCSNLKGTYTSNDNLFLFEDGTYNYEENGDAAYGHFGNYIINGNEIILNQLFTHGSDIGVFPEKAQIKGKINKDGSITLKLKKNVKFKKKTTAISGNYDTLYKAVGGYLNYLEKEIKK